MFFFFNDTATTEIYTLSLHDALPIFMPRVWRSSGSPSKTASSFETRRGCASSSKTTRSNTQCYSRSEEHTSELQSHLNLVCRLLLEKKKHRHTPYESPQSPRIVPQPT